MATSLEDANEHLKSWYGEQVKKMYEANEFMRKGHSVWIDHDPRWLIDRERFRRQYEGMQREGLEKGYLDDDLCTVGIDTGWYSIEWDETWDEYGKRMQEYSASRNDPQVQYDLDL